MCASRGRGRWIGLVCILIIGFLTGALQGGAIAVAGEVKLTFAGGPSGGTWNILSAAIAELIRKEIPRSSVTVVPGGGTANLSMVSTGDADLGLSQPFVALIGQRGEAPFKKPITNVRAVAKGFPVYWQFTVLEKLPIPSFKELKDKKYPLRICTLSKGNLGEELTQRVFAAYGIKYEDIAAWGGKMTFTGYPDAISLITDGHADGFIPLFEYPASVVMELQQARPIKQFSIDEDILKRLAIDGLGRGVIPAGTYQGMKKDTVTINAANMIIARQDMPDDVVYSVTKAYVESRDRIAASAVKALSNYPLNDLANGLGIPLHPGAERYFKERGFIK